MNHPRGRDRKPIHEINEIWTGCGKQAMHRTYASSACFYTFIPFIIFISWLLFSTSTRRLLGYVILFHFIFIFSSRVFCFIFFSFTTRREPFDSVPVPERRVAEKIWNTTRLIWNVMIKPFIFHGFHFISFTRCLLEVVFCLWNWLPFHILLEAIS